MNLTEPVDARRPARLRARTARRLWPLVLVAVLCVGALPSSTAAAAGGTTARSTYTTMSTSTFAHRLFLRINKRRAAHDCRALRQNSALALAARRHSELMSRSGSLSHRLAGEPDLASRAVAAGYTPWRILAENLAWGYHSPRGVFRAWVRSPGHRANLDNCRLRNIGVGVLYRNGRPWVTADFGRHR